MLCLCLMLPSTVSIIVLFYLFIRVLNATDISNREFGERCC